MARNGKNKAGGREDRTHERLPFDREGLKLELQASPGRYTETTVRSVDLSTGGLAMYSKMFVYPGSVCTLRLKDLLGRDRALTGRITWCDYLPGIAHIVGMKFDSPADPRQFIDPLAITSSLDKANSNVDGVATGTVLLVDTEILDRDLLTMYLAETKINLLNAEGDASASKVLSTTPVDVVVTDLNLGDEKGEDLIKSIREQGFKGPIVLATGDSSTERIAAAKSNGATTVIEKPYQPTEMISLLRDLLLEVDIPASNEPIYSELEKVMSASAQVSKYIEVVTAKGKEIEAAVERNDVDFVRSSLKALHATGMGFGFPIVTLAAERALKALAASMSLAESSDSIRRTLMVLGRLRVQPSRDAA